MTKLLYVDDEQINLKLFEINFKNKYTVLSASNGLKGLDFLDEHQDIRVVISDMRMPFMDGLEFIKKAREKYPNKKFFILTGFDITEDIQEALETNLIIKYFRKPFNLNEIDDTIMEVLD